MSGKRLNGQGDGHHGFDGVGCRDGLCASSARGSARSRAREQLRPLSVLNAQAHQVRMANRRPHARGGGDIPVARSCGLLLTALDQPVSIFTNSTGGRARCFRFLKSLASARKLNASLTFCG